MSKIESIIEFECYDNKPSDCEWTLRKEDVPEIARTIKKLLMEELATEKHRLIIALHEAINRPMGVVPHEAEEFYNQNYYSNNSAQ